MRMTMTPKLTAFAAPQGGVASQGTTGLEAT